MRSKPVQWLMAAALISMIAAPGWAQPELVGEAHASQGDRATTQARPGVVPNETGVVITVVITLAEALTR